MAMQKNNARCTQARKATHGLDGQHQDMDRTLRGRVNQNDKGQGQMEKVRLSMVWPTLGSRTAKEQKNSAGMAIGLDHPSNQRFRAEKLHYWYLVSWLFKCQHRYNHKLDTIN